MNNSKYNERGTSSEILDVNTTNFNNSTHYFRQDDERWAKEKINMSDLSFEAVGCAITSMANLLVMSKVDENIDPLKLRDKLRDSLLENGGNLEWGKITEIYPNFVYEKELSNYNAHNSSLDYQKVKDLVDKGCMVEIQICDREKSGGLTHYVAACKVENNEIYVVDPATSEGPVPLSSVKWRDVDDLGIYAYQVYKVKK